MTDEQTLRCDLARNPACCGVLKHQARAGVAMEIRPEVDLETQAEDVIILVMVVVMIHFISFTSHCICAAAMLHDDNPAGKSSFSIEYLSQVEDNSIALDSTQLPV